MLGKITSLFFGFHWLPHFKHKDRKVLELGLL